jgi:hypothetical protein
VNGAGEPGTNGNGIEIWRREGEFLFSVSTWQKSDRGPQSKDKLILVFPNEFA